MTDSSHYYFNYPSEPTDDFGRPNAWLWGDDAIVGDDPEDWCFSPEDYSTALNLVHSAMAARGLTMPSPTEFHDMILDVADAFATNRRRSTDA